MVHKWSCQEAGRSEGTFRSDKFAACHNAEHKVCIAELGPPQWASQHADFLQQGNDLACFYKEVTDTDPWWSSKSKDPCWSATWSAPSDDPMGCRPAKQMVTCLAAILTWPGTAGLDGSSASTLSCFRFHLRSTPSIWAVPWTRCFRPYLPLSLTHISFTVRA